jgi:hypothetical protein
MNRRIFLRATAGFLVAPLNAQAQPGGKIYRIGILGLRPTADLVGPKPRSPSTTALLQGLRELGYVYGEHL